MQGIALHFLSFKQLGVDDAPQTIRTYLTVLKFVLPLLCPVAISASIGVMCRKDWGRYLLSGVLFSIALLILVAGTGLIIQAATFPEEHFRKGKTDFMIYGPIAVLLMFAFISRSARFLLQNKFKQKRQISGIKVLKDMKCEPLWGIVGLESCDFRSHFGGNLVNLYSCIYPENTIKETETVLTHHTKEIACWVLENKEMFSEKDRFQIILGWVKEVRETGRQIIKAGGDYDALADIVNGVRPVEPRLGWSNNVFDEL